MLLHILAIDECNDRYGRKRMYEALKIEYPKEDIPSEQIIYRIMQRMGISHRPKKRSNSITVVDKKAQKSDDLLRRNFYSDRPYSKLITDITEIKVKNKKMYVSAIFDCFNLKVLGLSIRELNYSQYFKQIKGGTLHSDRGR